MFMSILNTLLIWHFCPENGPYFVLPKYELKTITNQFKTIQGETYFFTVFWPIALFTQYAKTGT